jgi:hypothetical protein
VRHPCHHHRAAQSQPWIPRPAQRGCSLRQSLRFEQPLREAASQMVTRPPLPPRPGHPSSQVPPRTPPPAASSQHPASPLRAATSSQTSAESATIRGCGAPTLPPEGPTEQALAPLRASEGRRTCPLSGPRRGGSSRGGQRGAPGRTAPRSPRSAPSQPGAPASYVSRPRPDVGRYRRPDAARRGPTPTRPRRARCADPVRPSRPLASACRSRQPP